MIVCHCYGYWIFDVPGLKLTHNGDYPPRSAIEPKYWIRRPDGVPLRDQVHGIAVTGLALPKGIGLTLWPSVEEFLPLATRARITITRGPFGTPIRITHPDNLWTLQFGSTEQGSMQFESMKFDWGSFDEPPTRPVFTAVWRGLLDFYGPLWFSFTPLGPNAGWMYEEYIAKKHPSFAVVKGKQAENPYLSEEARREFEQGVAFTSEEKAARVDGDFGHLTHRAFTILDPEVHFIEPFRIPETWPRVLACDPANRRPFYFVWLAFDPKKETWIAYREFPTDLQHHEYRTSVYSIQDYATILRNLEGGERITARVCDPRFGPAEYSVKGQKLTSVVEDFARYGLHFDCRVPDTERIETGVERIRQLLWYDKLQPITEWNHPKLLIFKSLHSLTHSMQHWSFKPPSARDDRDLPNKFQETFKDPVDALRYAILYMRTPLGNEDPHPGYFSADDLAQENDPDWMNL